jgi:WD40 repeat protein/DNA-binding SARP family transcriptional activator
MTALRFRLLGPPDLSLGSQPAAFKTRKALALLAYLAVEKGSHRREEVADLLWPTADADDARSSLRMTIRRVRTALGDAADAVLLSTRDAVGLAHSAPLDLDITVLRGAHQQIRPPSDIRHHTRRLPDGLRQNVEHAVALYRGPFLGDLTVLDAPEFDTWLAGQRAHWLGMVSELLAWLTNVQMGGDDIGDALLTLQRWVSLDPGEDLAWRRLIEIYLAQGNRVGARQALSAYRRTLTDLGVDPSAQLEVLRSQIDAGVQAGHTVGGTVESRGPDETDLLQMPFVGRARELLQLRRAFERARAGEPQVVVLEGEAGIGKTRLADEFLAWAASQGADVVWSRSYETTVDLPYASLTEGLRNRLERENAPEDLLDDPWLAELSQLLPELRVRYPDLPPPTSDPALGRHQLFEAVTRLWKAFAGRRPLLMFRDDWHWSDTDSRDLLRYALRRFSEDQDSVLMIVAVSAEQLGTDRALAQWMGGLERDAPTSRLGVERLTEPDIVLWIAALAGTEGDGSFTDAAAARLGQWLIERSVGNPSQIIAALRSLLDQQVLTVRQSEEGSWTLDLTGLPRLSTAPAGMTERVSGMPSRHQDWGDAPGGRLLYGRREELDALERWVVTDRCREVAVVGIGGIGKTALAARLAQQVAPHFDFVLWRSLKNALPFDEWLADAVRACSERQHATLPKNQEERILLLLELLRAHRCLLVLDNLETVLEPGQHETTYREGYGDYGLVLERLGAVDHQSCVLLTSREKPAEVGVLEGEASPVRAFPLRGLGAAAGRVLLEHQRLDGRDEDWGALVERYAGNPLALQVVGETIGDVFAGEIGVFLVQGEAIFGGIRRLLDSQFNRLSPIEQALLFWLAIEREPVGFVELFGELEPPPTRGDVLEALEALRRRSLMEGGGRGTFTLQPVVLEYVTSRLVLKAVQEVRDGDPVILRTHALSKAQSTSYVRESQERLIVAPILDRLVAAYASKEQVEGRLLELVDQVRSQNRRDYAPGNAINLLQQVRGNLRGLDLSHLFIRQTYLQEANAQDVSLAGSTLVECALAEAFDSCTSATFSPDGRHLAAGTLNGEICVWRLADRTRMVSTEGHKGPVYAILWASNGRLLATGGLDATVKLWEVNQKPPGGRLVATLEGHTGFIWRVSFSQDSRLIASGSHDGTVKLWETSTGRLLRTFQGHEGAVWGVALSNDGAIVASSGSDGTVKLWEAATGFLLTTLEGHSGIVHDVVFTPDARLVASGGQDGLIRLWEVATGYLVSTLQGHTEQIWCLAVSADGQLLISGGGQDGIVHLWDLDSGVWLTALEAHASPTSDVAISPDARLFASASQDGTLKLWDTPSGKPVTTLQGYARGAWGLAWGGSGKLLANGTQDGAINLWDVAQGVPAYSLHVTLHGHTGIVFATALSGDGELLASGGQDDTVRLWQVSDGACLRTVKQAHDGATLSLVFSPDARHLITSGQDGLIKLWDVSNGEALSTIHAHTDLIIQVALSDDGHLLASASQDGTVKVWQIPSGRLLATLRDNDDLFWRVAVSGEGNLVASGGQSGRVNLWEAPSGRLLARFAAHEGQVWGVALSPDSRLIVSGGADRTVKLWDAATRQLIAQYMGHDGTINDVAVSPDGSLIASSSQDGAVKLWDRESGACRATLRPDRRYERMDITGLTGVSNVQKMVLKTLGAVERST